MGKEKISELHFGDKFITQLGEFTVIEKMQNDTIMEIIWENLVLRLYQIMTQVI